MKLINPIIIIIMLLNVGCSNEANPLEPAKSSTTQTGKADPITIYSATDALHKSKENAEKGLNAAQQVNQIILDSATQQQEALEKNQQ